MKSLIIYLLPTHLPTYKFNNFWLCEIQNFGEWFREAEWCLLFFLLCLSTFEEYGQRHWRIHKTGQKEVIWPFKSQKWANHDSLQNSFAHITLKAKYPLRDWKILMANSFEFLFSNLLNEHLRYGKEYSVNMVDF